MPEYPMTGEIWTKIGSDNANNPKGLQVKIEEVKKDTVLYHKIDDNGEADGRSQRVKIEMFLKNYINI